MIVTKRTARDHSEWTGISMDQIKLINGIKLPQIGFGTWQITDRDQMAEVFRMRMMWDIGYLTQQLLNSK